MRGHQRMQHLYAQRRGLREATHRLRNTDGGGQRLDAIRTRREATDMQLTIARRRQS